MKVRRISFTLDIEVMVDENQLVIQHIVKHNEIVIKSTTYAYSGDEVKGIDEGRVTRMKLKGKKTFALLKNYIIDILDDPSISPSSKYLLLTRYSKNAMLSSKASRSFIGKLVDQVLINQKKEVKNEPTEICALEGPATLPV